jgi:hypothetical protein
LDALEFLVRSEWPLVVGGSILLFYKPIKALLSGLSLKKIEGWGVKAEFEKGLDKVEELTSPKEIAKPEELPRIKFRDRETTYLEYADKLLPFLYENVSPEALVLDTWSRVEGDTRAMIDALHPMTGSIHTPPLRFEAAAKELGLSDQEIESLSVLRKLRNSIAHSADRSLTWEDAARFKESSQRLLDKMKKNWDELRKK